MLRLIHILDMHIDKESHQGRKHKKYLRLCKDAELLELKIVQWSQDLVHPISIMTYPCTYRTVGFILPQMYKIRLKTSEFFVGRCK